VVNCAASLKDDIWTLVVGARPGVAKIAVRASTVFTETGDIEKSLSLVGDDLVFGQNMRGSATYRRLMSEVLLARCIKEVQA
jgi:CO/xanthine dehydrogenase FAD-binding subunit